MREPSISVRVVADMADDVLRRIEGELDETLIAVFRERLRHRRLDLLANAVKKADGKLYVQLGQTTGESGEGLCELDDYGLPVLRVRDIAHHVDAFFRVGSTASEAAHA